MNSLNKNKKALLKKTLFLFGILFLVFASATIVLGATSATYENLIPLGDVGVSGGASGEDIEGYLNTLFKWSVYVAIILAVIMIAFGGLQYVSSESIPGKTKAKETITNAIVGLLLALGSYLILYTINPDILNINLKLDGTVNLNTGSGSSGGGVSGNAH